MPLAREDLDSNCGKKSVSNHKQAKQSNRIAFYLGQHSRGGLHIGGEVKPQLQALRGGTIQGAQKRIIESSYSACL
jgi:hypothetical protein